MAAKWKCPAKLVLWNWLEESLKAKDLTDWEKNFLHSIEEYLSFKDELTERQVEILERIYSEKT